jgi:TonB family protein
MKLDSNVLQTATRTARSVSPPMLLVELEPWHRDFLRNLKDILWPQRRASLNLSSRPGEFWPDVFVRSVLPWRRFMESGGYHVLAIAALLFVPRFWPHAAAVMRPVSRPEDVIFYSAAEYLPPLDTGTKHTLARQKGEPAYATQPILSVPPDSDNRKQTIVTPPDVKLNHDVPLPNVVAWKPVQPAVPLAATENLSRSVTLPTLPQRVIAPAPQVAATAVRQAAMLEPQVVAPAPKLAAAPEIRGLRVPQAAVVPPPPEIQADTARRLGDINIGHQNVVAPAPRLPVSEQHTVQLAQAGLGTAAPIAPAPTVPEDFSRKLSAGPASNEQVVAPAPVLPAQQGISRRAEASLGGKVAVVPPAPSVHELRSQRGGGSLVALNLHPLPPATAVAAPVGNRRGTFAATPEGKPNASGSPDIRGEQTNATGAANKNAEGLPAGLHVGASPAPTAGTDHAANAPVLSADVTPPRVGTPQRIAREVSEDQASETERKVFGDRKFYSMTLNLPNLNSAGGSWVIRFAELKDAAGKGPLIAPEAVKEVDPGYPLELMRHNIGGTVTLYAVIRSDGSVGDVRVLDGVDDRLDQYACQALLHWKFLPAMRDGNAIPLAAVVKIPFRPSRSSFAF